MGWRSTNIAEKLVDYANTTNIKFSEVDQVTAGGVCRLVL